MVEFWSAFLIESQTGRPLYLVERFRGVDDGRERMLLDLSMFPLAETTPERVTDEQVGCLLEILEPFGCRQVKTQRSREELMAVFG